MMGKYVTKLDLQFLISVHLSNELYPPYNKNPFKDFNFIPYPSRFGSDVDNWMGAAFIISYIMIEFTFLSKKPTFEFK